MGLQRTTDPEIVRTTVPRKRAMPHREILSVSGRPGVSRAVPTIWRHAAGMLPNVPKTAEYERWFRCHWCQECNRLSQISAPLAGRTEDRQGRSIVCVRISQQSAKHHNMPRAPVSMSMLHACNGISHLWSTRVGRTRTRATWSGGRQTRSGPSARNRGSGCTATRPFPARRCAAKQAS
jgi:hypothetical protein